VYRSRWLFRIEPQDATIDLIEQKQFSVVARIQCLRAIQFGVLARTHYTDRLGPAPLPNRFSTTSLASLAEVAETAQQTA